MPRPQPPGPDSSDNVLSTRLPDIPRSETSLTELADRLAASVPDPALSADLALQIVLNEIAELACITTGATGAAIALQREGELVCRASSGTTAPELGATLNTKQGLSGECVRTQQVQVCDDIEEDPRVDPTATRQLGARSVIVLPLLRGSEVMGVMEAFSADPRAFAEQDRGILDVLGQRVLRNVEIAAEWRPAHPNSVGSGDIASEPTPERKVSQSAEPDPSTWAGLSNYATDNNATRTPVTTYALGIIVLLVAIGLWARIFDRLGWLRVSAGSPAMVAATNTGASTPGNAVASIPASDPASVPAAAEGISASAKAVSPQPSKARTLPPGSLAVYDRGKEVFRMLPGEPASPKESALVPAAGAVEQAVSVEPEIISENGAPGISADLVRRVQPEYPEEALREKIQGLVVLNVLAGGDGIVRHVQLISGPPLLGAAAITAVNQWQFKPHVVKGRATDIARTVILKFKLPQ